MNNVWSYQVGRNPIKSQHITVALKMDGNKVESFSKVIYYCILYSALSAFDMSNSPPWATTDIIVF